VSQRAPGGRLRTGASALGTVISIVALAAVVWWALNQEPPQLPDTRGQLGAMLGAIGLYGVATVVRAERWHALLIADGAAPHRSDSYALTVVGYAANNLLPARAGDAIRIVLMAPRAGSSRRTVLGTLLAERLLDIAVILVLFAVVGYGVLGAIGADSVEVILGVVAAVAVLAALAFSLLRRRDRFHAFIAPILSSTLGLRSRRGLILVAVTVVIWGLEAGVWMAVGAAVDFQMDPVEGVYLVALASVFALIPSGPGYAGTQDAAAVIGIKALGGSGAVAVAYLVTLRFVIVVPITVLGLLLGAGRYGGLRRLRAARAEGGT
jgi:uncharacterized membrane protein YbhN (UPF0104 family)